MWYFAWILGTLLACAFGIITALALEHLEDTRGKDALKWQGKPFRPCMA